MSLPKHDSKEVTVKDIEDHKSESGVTASADLEHLDVIERRAMKKFDWVVMPFITAFYFLSFLDRSNIGNARTGGLLTDLGISATQFSIALTVTYIPYSLIELPSNLVLKKFGPDKMLPLMVTLWGIVTIMQGVITNFAGLIVCRFFLGLFEGGLLPGVILYLSMFYRRHQLQLRVTLLFSATSLAGAFSGLLAGAILGMDGVGGKRGWSWIFILEGLFTVVFGLVSFFFMPASPRQCRFLTEEEKVAAERMITNDWTPEHDPFSWREVFSAFKSPQVIIMAPIFFANGCTLFGLAYFAPTIISSFGFSAVKTNLLSVPPYAASFVLNIVVAVLSDRYKMRGPPTIFAGLIAITGYALWLGSSSLDPRYASIFLQTIGAYLTAPTISAWNVNNIMPHYKRGTSIAIGFFLSNCGGILSTWIFTGPPDYTTGTRINCAMAVLITVCGILNMGYLHRQNQLKAKELLDNPRVEGSAENEAEKRRLGDKHPSFKYTL